MARRKAVVNEELRKKLLKEFESGKHWTANELADRVGSTWSAVFVELERMKREKLVTKEPQRWYVWKPEPQAAEQD